MTVERSRPVRMPSVKEGGIVHLLRDIRAVGLAEPVRELHFAWCCEHAKAAHRRNDSAPTCAVCDGGEDPEGGWFAPVHHQYRHERDWRFDLAWPGRMLAAEVDGGVWTAGRHVQGGGFEADLVKLNEAVLRGWRVLRFTTGSNGMIERGLAVEQLERALG